MTSFSRLTAALLMAGFGFTAPVLCLAADEPVTQDQLIYTLKNRDAYLKDRTKAFDQLLQQPNHEFQNAVFSILENQKESRILLSHVLNTLAFTKDRDLLDALREKLRNRKSSTLLRANVLSVLWKSEPADTAHVIRNIAQDPYESESFRVTALSYLTHTANAPENLEVARLLFKNNREPSKVRQAAGSILEATGDSNLTQEVYLTILTDKGFDWNAREFAILRGESMNFPDFEDHLLEILKDPAADARLRRTALKALIKDEMRLPGLIPQFRGLLQLVTNASLLKDLKSVVEKFDQMQRELARG